MQHVCEQNGSLKRLVLPFSIALGGRGALWDNWPTDVLEIATLHEFDENVRFFIVSCNPYMGHTLRLLYSFHLKNDT
jgi:hypothetical protein